jgi:hypothetical protein
MFLSFGSSLPSISLLSLTHEKDLKYAISRGSESVSINVSNRFFSSFDFIDSFHFKIPFAVNGYNNAVSRVTVIVSLHKLSDRAIDESVNIKSNIVLDEVSVSPQAQSITISGLRSGVYSLILALKDSISNLRLQNTEVLTTLRVFPMQEFVPSYIWQPLYPWHTIPSGVETRLFSYLDNILFPYLHFIYNAYNRLPLSDRAEKEARIPDPWRLQLLMPNVLYFSSKLFSFVRLYDKSLYNYVAV